MPQIPVTTWSGRGVHALAEVLLLLVLNMSLAMLNNVINNVCQISLFAQCACMLLYQISCEKNVLSSLFIFHYYVHTGVLS